MSGTVGGRVHSSSIRVDVVRAVHDDVQVIVAVIANLLLQCIISDIPK
jgi:hypothetical protein